MRALLEAYIEAEILRQRRDEAYKSRDLRKMVSVDTQIDNLRIKCQRLQVGK
jgi:hypothetical protein